MKCRINKWFFVGVWAIWMGCIASAQATSISESATVTVLLHRVYIDGEVSEEVLTEQATFLTEPRQKYKDWQLVDQDDTQAVFMKRINDISPLLKTSGYFGISDGGMLQIFEGVPTTNKVIHSFFQIDMEKLEVSRKKQLKRGIRVKTKETYEEVLNTMKKYSVKRG